VLEMLLKKIEIDASCPSMGAMPVSKKIRK
jgi:hypothetical protein